MSAERKLRLAESTFVEPLVHQWAAWAHVVSPATAGMHLRHTQFPTLRSYLDNPAHHARAARDPQFAGSPFVDIAPERAGEVAALLAEMERAVGADAEFGRVVIETQDRFAREATGQSIEHLYGSLPDALRGCVELVYDYQHRASIRLLEGMLYAGPHYRPDLQSLRLERLARDTDRSFFMSTPRLPSASSLEWQIPWRDDRVDALFALDTAPKPLDEIRQLLGVGPRDDARLGALLTDAPLRLRDTWNGPGVRVRYFGHACVLVESGGVSVITDAFIGARPIAGIERYSYDDLPRTIDYALITHNHQDHFALETLLRLRHRLGTLVVPKTAGSLYGDVSLRTMARAIGFERVVDLGELDSIEIPGGAIVGVPFLGEHGDLAHGKIGYVVRFGSEQMLFAADSDCLDDEVYKNVRKAIGRVDTVFLGTESVGAPLSWTCGPFFPRRPTAEQDRTRRYHGSDAARGLRMLDALGATRLFSYAIGLEPWFEHLLGIGMSEDSVQFRESEKLLAAARGRGFEHAERPFAKREIVFEGGKVHREYWPMQLRSLRSAPAVPFDRDAAPGSGRSTHAFGDDVPRGLESLRESTGADHASAMVAAVSALIHRYGGCADLVIGLREGAAPILPVRVDVSGEPAVSELLSRVRAVLSLAREHGATALPPLDAVVSVCTGEPVDLPGGSAISIALDAEGTGTVAMDGRFEGATCDEFAARLGHLVTAAAASPARSILALDLETRAAPADEDQFAF